MHTPILARLGPESVVKSADSSTESAYSATDSVIVGQLPLSNIFRVTVISTADFTAPMIL